MRTLRALASLGERVGCNVSPPNMYARFDTIERVCEERGGREGTGGSGARVAVTGEGFASAIAPATVPSRAVEAVEVAAAIAGSMLRVWDEVSLDEGGQWGLGKGEEDGPCGGGRAERGGIR